MRYANYENQLLRKLSKKIIYFLSSTLIIILFDFDFDFYTVQFGNIFLFFYLNCFVYLQITTFIFIIVKIKTLNNSYQFNTNKYSNEIKIIIPN